MKADPSNWTGIEEFTAWQAACLLCDVEPFTPTRDDPAPPFVTAMKTRIVREIQPSRDTTCTKFQKTGRVNVWSHEPQYRQQTVPGTRYYRRTDVERLAVQLGRAFLSEDAREDETGKMRKDKEENMLALIRLLAEMYVEKSGPGLRSGDDINVKALHKCIADYARKRGIETPLGLTQFTAYLNRAASLLR